MGVFAFVDVGRGGAVDGAAERCVNVAFAPECQNEGVAGNDRHVGGADGVVGLLRRGLQAEAPAAAEEIRRIRQYGAAGDDPRVARLPEIPQFALFPVAVLNQIPVQFRRSDFRDADVAQVDFARFAAVDVESELQRCFVAGVPVMDAVRTVKLDIMLLA